ncbi:MAG: acyltransferase [Phenylobacterium sp.]|nr:MAG: acyltransferase [Phenylobacterium sp.]
MRGALPIDAGEYVQSVACDRHERRGSSRAEFDVTSPPAAPSRGGSVRGLDTLRFVAALWVAFSHGASPPVDSMFGVHGPATHLVSAGMALVFNGTAAVVVFFVISGFCIHLPNIGAERLDWRRFLTRRLVRIVPPLLAIIGLTRWLGDRYVAAVDTVLWSVYCELIYYALYPLLFALLRHWRLRYILIASIAPMAILLALKPTAAFLWHFGAWTWLYCAPFWLLGAELAERYRRGSLRTRGSIWIWRCAAVVLCGLATVALYHLPIAVGYPWTMPAFAVFATFWVAQEIGHAEQKGAVAVLELLGAGSYSLYLAHKIPLEALPAPTGALGWLELLAAIAAATLALYVFVERPSHQLARWLGRRRRAPAFAV